MDLIKLRSNDWQPSKNIEGYESLIWTERFLSPGEVQIKTHDIEYFLSELPLNSLVSHQDTREVMIIETHEISVSDDGNRELTISGRSFDSFLENRIMNGDKSFWEVAAGDPVVIGPNGNVSVDGNDEDVPPEDQWEMARKYTASQAAALVIWNTVVDNNPIVTGISGDVNVFGQRIKEFTGRARDLLPNVVVTTTGNFTDSSKEWSLQFGDLYAQVRGILDIGGIGLRCIRPVANPPTAGVLTFDNQGNPVRTTTTDITELRLDVYAGSDRRSTLTFDSDLGDLTGVRYIWTTAGTKNLMGVDTDAWGTILVTRENDPRAGETTGLKRRMAYTTFDTPLKKRRNTQYRTRATNQGRRALAETNRPAIFDGQISPDTSYKYKEDYDLGDLVTIKADYGVQQTMQIIEHIRNEDVNGESEYPTLAQPT